VTHRSAERRPAGRGGPVRPVLLVALVLALAVQCVVLYAPQAPGVSPFPSSDKVVHLTVFFVPVLIGLLAGLPPRLVVAVFAGHAVLSEVVQGVVLPDRSGDPVDAVADLAGVALAVLAWRGLGRSPAREGS
jgi:hypothetical protein